MHMFFFFFANLLLAKICYEKNYSFSRIRTATTSAPTKLATAGTRVFCWTAKRVTYGIFLKNDTFFIGILVSNNFHLVTKTVTLSLKLTRRFSKNSSLLEYNHNCAFYILVLPPAWERKLLMSFLFFFVESTKRTLAQKVALEKVTGKLHP